MIPVLMDASKTVAALVSDKTAGLGPLSETQKCEVTEERNGEYVLDLKIPMTAKHFHDIKVGGVIRAKANETSRDQLFRIYKISKPMNGIVTISANHISYDLGKTSVLPCSATGALAAMNAIKRSMQGGSGFELTTDIVNDRSKFTNKIPQSCRACFGGSQGSMLDVFGGEYEWDNNRVILHAHRGIDRGVVLRYGKNITDIKQDENIEATYTAVMPYVSVNDGETITGTLQTMIESAEPRILNLDLSDKFNVETEPPTAAEIDEKARAYIEANNLTEPKVSISVSFLHLADTEEYKDIAPLEHVCLCDTLKVEYPELGVSATAKVVKTVFDTLREKYNEIEIGSARSSLAQTITGISEETETAATGYMDQAIAAFSTLMSQGLGLFVTKDVQPDGSTKLYMHNRPTLAESQYQWTLNSNGLALSTDYGQTWRAGIDSEGNALFNVLSANEVNAMKINGGYITYGFDKKATLTSDETGAFWYGDGSMTTSLQGDYYVKNVSFLNPAYNANALALINRQNLSMEYLANYDPNEGKLANSLYLQYAPSSGSNITLVNYNLYAGNNFRQNEVKLSVDYNSSDSLLYLINRDLEGTAANQVAMTSNPELKNRIDVISFQYGSNEIGSYLILNGNGNASLKGYAYAQISGEKVYATAVTDTVISSGELSSLQSEKDTLVYAKEKITAQSLDKIVVNGTNKVEIKSAEIDLTGTTVMLGTKKLYFRTRDGITYVCAE